uniref:2Fe-2S ferredoxin-type domain-containing protein n=1 Tax=Varanus komodoensis TaxID=61221 RepID=A0A8D2KVJ3_VARKO
MCVILKVASNNLMQSLLFLCFLCTQIKIKLVLREKTASLFLFLNCVLSVILTGTKYGCGIGGCGACTVMISTYNPDSKKIRHYPANSCPLPFCSLYGVAVTTVEEVGTTQTKLNPIQVRLAKCHGSQCGFCTPGVVMSIMEQIVACLDGNLCRCTGYRPIIDSFSVFSPVKETNR